MRKVARVEKEGPGVRWVILCESESGIYLFFCQSEEEGSATGDSWFATVEEAERVCAQELGVARGDWIPVGDPLPGCQDDWISPVRVPGRDTGHPRWGALERLIDGQWVELWPGEPRPTIEAAIRGSRTDQAQAAG